MIGDLDALFENASPFMLQDVVHVVGFEIGIISESLHAKTISQINTCCIFLSKQGFIA